MSERFTTSIGRLLQGDCFVPQTTDQSGRPRVIKQGPNAGKPNPQFFIAVGFPKTPGCQSWMQEPHAFFQAVARVGQADFPGGQSQRPGFAWKVRDGDSPLPNQSGRIVNQIEGFAGHWVCSFQSSFPPKCFSRHIGYLPEQQLSDPSSIRRGHYVSVNGTVSGNGELVSNSGVYLNLDLISFEGFGPEIITGPIAADAFAGPAPVLPPGASMVPIGAAPAPVVALPPMVAPPPVIAPPPVVAPPPVQPYAGFMAAPPPSAVPGPIMLPAAGGATYQQLIAAGWSDATLLQHGMMAA